MSPTCSTPTYSTSTGSSPGVPQVDVPIFDGWVWFDPTATEFALPPERLIDVGNSEGLLLEMAVTATGDATAIATVSVVVERTAASSDQAGAWSALETIAAGTFISGKTSLSRVYGPRSAVAIPMPRGLVRVRLESIPPASTYVALRLRLWATLS